MRVLSSISDGAIGPKILFSYFNFFHPHMKHLQQLLLMTFCNFANVEICCDPTTV